MKKRLISILLILFFAMPGIAAASGGYQMDLLFEDVATNGTPASVQTEGSPSARVVEDGAGNKAYTVLTQYSDNSITVQFPQQQTAQKYFVQFDMKFSQNATSGQLLLEDGAGGRVTLFTIDEQGTLYGTDGKKIGGIGLNVYTTVGIFIDLEYKCISVYLDGKIRLGHWSRSDLISGASRMTLELDKSGVEGAVFLDRIRLYEGEQYRDERTSVTYNEETLDYTPVDESQIPQAVYINRNLDDESNLGVTMNKKTNDIVHETEGDNGYLKFIKTTGEDAFLDITLPTTAKQLVVEADFRYDSELVPTQAFFLRDTVTSSSQTNFTAVNIQNASIQCGGTSVSMAKKRWYKISLVMNLKKGLYDLWVDDQMVMSGSALPAQFKTPSLWRVYVAGGSDNGEIMVDNLHVYEGEAPRDVSQEQVAEVSRYTDDAAISFLQGKTALQTYSSMLFSSGAKQPTDVPCVNVGDEALVSQDTLEKLFDRSVSVSGDTISIDGIVTMKIGEAAFRAGGETIEMEAAPQEINGTLMIPIVGCGPTLSAPKKFYNDERGMLLISDIEYERRDSRTKEANLYLFFDREEPEKLKEDFMAATDNGAQHPRIMADAEDFARLRQEIETNPHKKEWYAYVKNQADQRLEKEVPVYTISEGRLLDVSNDMLSRALYLGFTYQMTKDERYAQKLYADLEAVCSFEDWHPDHTLDTGSMSAAVAIGFDWIYETLTEEQRQFIAERAKRNGLGPIRANFYGSATYSTTFWANTETNWAVWVCGNSAMLAMAIAEYDMDYCMEFLRNAYCCMEKMWYAFAPDGAWYEGPSYWGGVCMNVAMLASTYETVMKKPYFGLDYKGLDKYAQYQVYFSDPSGFSNNFHDSYYQQYHSPGQFYLADEFGQMGLMKYRVECMDRYNWAPDVRDLLWYDCTAESSQESIELDKDAYYRETEYVSMRENWEDEGALWVSTHGGYSNNAHDHIDPGAFILNLGGVRWAVDLGTEPMSYLSDANNPSIQAGYNAYYFYRRKGEGHNIVVINPDENLEIDQTAFAKVAPPVSGENAAYTSIDLSGAYAKSVDEYTRGYLISDGRRSFTVRDEIKLKGQSELYWFMHTQADITIVDDHTALLFEDGKQLKVQFITNAEEAQLSVMEAEKLPQSVQFTETANPGVTKLAYRLQASGDVQITVKMSLLGEPPSATPPQDIPISQWSVDGVQSYEYSYPAAQIQGLSVDGQSLFGFSPDTYRYECMLKEGNQLPQIQVDAQCETQLFTYDGLDGMKLVEIRAMDPDGAYNSYILRCKPYSELAFENYERYNVVGADVSSEQTDEPNYRTGSYDGDLNTRWSADGIGEWMVQDLGEVKEIDAFGLAFWKGAERTYSYEILVSEDGENFTEVLSGESSGKSEEIEVTLLEESVSARYVKYIGYGNSVNKWNNVIELATLKKK